MADKKAQPTKEEIEKQVKAERDTAVKTLKLGFWDYALPKLVTPAQYGEVAQAAEVKFEGTVEKRPSEEIYQALFAPQLRKKGGAITSPYLQETSYNVLIDAFMRITVQDAYEYMGAKTPIESKYVGKYMFQLDEKGREAIINKCLTRTTRKKVMELLEEANKGDTLSLEQLLGEKPKEKK